MSRDASSQGRLPLEQFIAVNDEIAALVHAGIPLEPSLAAMSEELPGKLGKKFRELHARLGSGESLLEAVRDDPDFPPVYSALIEAGGRSGHLGKTLHEVSSTARELVDVRRYVLRSLFYPVLILLLAWTALVFWLLYLVPRMQSLFADFPSSEWIVALLNWTMENRLLVGMVGIAVPLLVIAWFVAGVWRSARAGSLTAGGGVRWFRWIPWLGKAQKMFDQANFLDLLALMIRNEVPLPEALRSAAGATGNRPLVESAERLAERVERGLGTEQEEPPRKPPSSGMLWILLMQRDESQWMRSLENAARVARMRGERLTFRATFFLPTLLTVASAGVVVLTYGIMFFGPWYALLRLMTAP